jgi:uncharacterized membrane protein YfcA
LQLPSTSALQLLAIAAISAVAGTMNAIAGGGTLLTFPALIGLGIPPLAFQTLISIYGGYFGAGVGILMLAGLGFMGHTNIHRMNGLKNWGGLCMNAVAAVAFAASGLVIWPVALTMAAGSFGGGYVGSRVAQRVGQRVVRITIATIGISSGILLMITR